MREFTRRKRDGDLADQLICDHALFHLEADLRWLELTAGTPRRAAQAVARMSTAAGRADVDLHRLRRHAGARRRPLRGRTPARWSR